MRFNKHLATVITIAMALGIFAFPVNAGAAEDARSQLQDVNQQIQENRDKLENNKQEQASITAQMAEIDAEINNTQKELNSLYTNINDLEDKIYTLEDEVEAKQLKMAGQQTAMGERLNYMYEGGDITYLEVLLGAENFRDFLTRVDMLNSIIDQDRAVITQVQEEKAKLDIQVADLDNKRKQLEESRRSQKDKEAQLKGTKEDKEAYSKKLEEDASTYNQEFNELQATSNLLAQQIRDQQGSTDYTEPQPDGTIYAVGTGQLNWPCPGNTDITSPFGMRYHPISGDYKMHTGIDIGAGEGSAIVAADSGTVISAGWMGGYGNCTIVDHGNGISTLYAHQSEILVSEGQAVSKGSNIGLVGSTGFSTGAHLHFEVRLNGEPVDPSGYM